MDYFDDSTCSILTVCKIGSVEEIIDFLENDTNELILLPLVLRRQLMFRTLYTGIQLYRLHNSAASLIEQISQETYQTVYDL